MIKITRENYNKVNIQQVLQSLHDCKMHYGDDSLLFEMLRDLYTGPGTGLEYYSNENVMQVIDTLKYYEFRNGES